jgi:hypothetical protein
MVDDNPVLSYFGTCSIFPYPPHVGKITNVSSGTLVRPIDWFDLIMHAAPWILLLIKIVLTMKENGVTDNS